jgi:hypothetical protein
MRKVSTTSICLAGLWCVAMAADKGHEHKAAAKGGEKIVYPRTPSPTGAVAYIVSPKDGETVSGKFTINFGLSGMGVAPAGVQIENTGHHHLVIDDKLPPTDQPMGMSAKLVHFGKGQTETVVELPPGKHTLQLVLGDFAHIPHNPPVISKKITVTVAEK